MLIILVLTIISPNTRRLAEKTGMISLNMYLWSVSLIVATASRRAERPP
jgi:hypothetical protein